MSCSSFDHAMTLAVAFCCIAVAGLAASIWLEVLDQIKRRKSVRHTTSLDPLSPADVIRYANWRNEQMINALNEYKDGGMQ